MSNPAHEKSMPDEGAKEGAGMGNLSSAQRTLWRP